MRFYAVELLQLKMATDTTLPFLSRYWDLVAALYNPREAGKALEFHTDPPRIGFKRYADLLERLLSLMVLTTQMAPPFFDWRRTAGTAVATG